MFPFFSASRRAVKPSLSYVISVYRWLKMKEGHTCDRAVSIVIKEEPDTVVMIHICSHMKRSISIHISKESVPGKRTEYQRRHEATPLALIKPVLSVKMGYLEEDSESRECLPGTSGMQRTLVRCTFTCECFQTRTRYGRCR